MGHLLRYDERPADITGQAVKGQDGWGQGNLTAANGEVCTAGDREEVQGCLWDRVAIQWR